MRKNLLLFSVFMLLGAISMSGQFNIDPNFIGFSGDGDSYVEVQIDITNSTSEDANIFWIFEKGEGYPENWTTQVCDANLCYAPNALTCPTNNPNIFLAGQTRTFSIKVTVSGGVVDGDSYGILKLYSDSDFSVLVGESSANSTSSIDVSSEDIIIFPNPTTDFFQLKSDNDIEAISIYNIAGRKVQSMNHSEGMMHDVTNLRTGMYLVRLQDDSGEIVKTMRLSKR